MYDEEEENGEPAELNIEEQAHVVNDPDIEDEADMDNHDNESAAEPHDSGYQHRYGKDYMMTTNGNGSNNQPLSAQQMSMEKGLQTFRSDGTKAVKSELQQLHDQVVIQPNQPKELTADQKWETLAYLMIIK